MHNDYPGFHPVDILGPGTFDVQINKDYQFAFRQFATMNDGVFEFDFDLI
jgi:hypothetical protein